MILAKAKTSPKGGYATIMDRISESLLNEFSGEHEIHHLKEEDRFEHFASYVTVRRHYSETFDSGEIVTGSGGDTGIDGLAIIANSVLITDLDAFTELAEKASYLEVSFIFVQAERSAGFEAQKIGNFGFGVRDFFSESPKLPRNENITKAAEIMSAIFGLSSKFRGNPSCRLYYVTTGTWNPGDANLEGRRQAEVNDLVSTRLFSDVQFSPIDAEHLHRLYRQTRNAVSKQFTFDTKTVIPEIPGVQESYLGYLAAKEFLKLVTDEDGEILGGLFYDNVRDWLDFNEVNDEIKATLESPVQSSRFVLMNNGITIIARGLKGTGNRFAIENYSIVNGCQTSHVLFDKREQLNDNVMIPVRLIGTQDEEIINDIIRATNRQTAVKEEQFYALEEFPKELERYFQTFDDPHKLYYERRTNQYDRLSIEKTRIVTPQTMIKAFAAMFLDEPHRTTRNYAALKARVGAKTGAGIFIKGHRMEPYYTAAYALYKLEFFFRTSRLAAKYKPAKFHILQAIRFVAQPAPVPRFMNSREMERYCGLIMEKLWDPISADKILTLAARIIEVAANNNFDRDIIRTEPFTQRVLATFRDLEPTETGEPNEIQGEPE